MYDNAIQIHNITDLDSLTPIGRTLKRGGATFDGTLMTVQTKLVKDDGTVVHDWLATGAGWTTPSVSKAQYDWQADDLAAFLAAADGAIFWLWFRVFVTGASPAEYDTFPHDGRKLKIVVNKAA